MKIHVVEPGDTIHSIAETYGVSAAKLIQDNDLINAENLVIGQTIVIVFPKQTHTVKEGETLEEIANFYGVTIMQLLRNNPHLSDRKHLLIDEVLVICYDTKGKIRTNGFVYPYIDKDILIKTLPNLTYISIFNYTSTKAGELIAYYDDSDIIETAKMYGVIPLMMTSTLTTFGKPNIETAYEILLNEEVQERHVNNLLIMLKSKGYYGLNLTFSYLTVTTQKLYYEFLSRITNRIRSEGYLVFVTLNPHVIKSADEVGFDRIDYSNLIELTDNFTFLNFVWGTNLNPPLPVTSYYNMKNFLDYALTHIPEEKMNIGTPVIGYNWDLPFNKEGPGATSLTLNAVIILAHDINSIILFDESSRTPYFHFYLTTLGNQQQHMIWFIDARTIDSLMELIAGNALNGIGIWNIMVYYNQMWLVINSQFDVEKVIAPSL